MKRDKLLQNIGLHFSNDHEAIAALCAKVFGAIPTFGGVERAPAPETDYPPLEDGWEYYGCGPVKEGNGRYHDDIARVVHDEWSYTEWTGCGNGDAQYALRIGSDIWGRWKGIEVGVMSATPRTDALLNGGKSADNADVCDLLDLSRELETELTQALERIDDLTSSVHSCHHGCQRPMCVLRQELADMTDQRDAAMDTLRRNSLMLAQTQACPTAMKGANQ